MRPSSTSGALAAFAERLRGALRKAVREAKRHSTGPRPTSATRPRCSALVDAALERRPATRSWRSSRRSRAASRGSACTTACVQLALKLTAPGVPDIYQGCELWDFSLVDPDNRRPRRFRAARRAARSRREELARDRARAFAQWLRHWQDGRVKLAVTRALLELRAREAALFAAGDYARVRGDGAARRRDRRLRAPPRAARRADGRAALSRARGAQPRLARHADSCCRADAEGAVDVFTGRSVRGDCARSGGAVRDAADRGARAERRRSRTMTVMSARPPP